MPVWASESARLPALRAQLQLLADDGLNPNRYAVATTPPQDGELCADIDISRNYLQALQDLHYGRLLQSHFEPLWRVDGPPTDRQAQLLSIAVPGMNDIAAAFDWRVRIYRNIKACVSCTPRNACKPRRNGSRWATARCCVRRWKTRACRNWPDACTAKVIWHTHW